MPFESSSNQISLSEHADPRLVRCFMASIDAIRAKVTYKYLHPGRRRRKTISGTSSQLEHQRHSSFPPDSKLTTATMRFAIASLATLLAAVDATFIRKWNLRACPEHGVSARCNRIPAGHCCNHGNYIGGSVQIANMPSFVDIAVPYSGRSGHSKNGSTRCALPKVSEARPGDISCYSNPRVGTGVWIHCSRYFHTSQCLSMSSAPHKRDIEGSQALDNFDPNHHGYIDEEEAALPPISFHGLNSEQISEDEFNRMTELELVHELNGTLHLLYPDHYPHNYMDWYSLLADNSTAAEDLEDASHALDAASAQPTSPAIEPRSTTAGTDTKTIAPQK
jgi:hypothetical protein